MAFTDIYAQDVANLLLVADGTTSPTAPAALYLAAFSADPGVTGSPTNEITEGNYARQNLVGTLGAPTAGAFTNSVAAITFPDPTVTWSATTFVGICDASAAGNVLWTTAITSVTPAAGSPLSFAISNLNFDTST